MTRPSIPPAPYRGGCLCGAVRYEYNARPLALNACHCLDCKRLSGASYFAGVHALAEHFVWRGETQIYTKTADSGREIDIHRCPQCGTRLWHHPRAVSTKVDTGFVLETAPINDEGPLSGGKPLHTFPESGPAAPQLIFFTAGTLDDSRWFVPTSHIWAEGAQPDVEFAEDALVIPGPPADRQRLWDHFAAIYPE